eukprot:908496-Pyramimonas_sp.AAC.1
MGRIVFLINPSCPPPDDHLKPPCPPPDDYRGQGGEGAPAGRRLHAAVEYIIRIIEKWRKDNGIKFKFSNPQVSDIANARCEPCSMFARVPKGRGGKEDRRTPLYTSRRLFARGGMVVF